MLAQKAVVVCKFDVLHYSPVSGHMCVSCTTAYQCYYATIEPPHHSIFIFSFYGNVTLVHFCLQEGGERWRGVLGVYGELLDS